MLPTTPIRKRRTRIRIRTDGHKTRYRAYAIELFTRVLFIEHYVTYIKRSKINHNLSLQEHNICNSTQNYISSKTFAHINSTSKEQKTYSTYDSRVVPHRSTE